MIDDRLTLYRKVLRIRTSFKTISQISWNLAQLEKSFPINNADVETLEQLLNAYTEHFSMLEETMKKLEEDIK